MGSRYREGRFWMGLERRKSEGVMGDDSELVEVSGIKRVTEEVWARET